MTEIARVDPKRASNDAWVTALTDVMNDAYNAAEQGIWTKDLGRTNVDEMRRWITAGEVVAASDDGSIVGAIRTHMMDASTGWFGALSVVPTHAGRGIARELVAHVEDVAAEQGAREMQLEVLVASGGHAHLDRIGAWYERLGYNDVGRQDAAELMPDDMPFAAVPLEVVVMRKRLS